jgi:predicted glycogen debranching enzyme
VLLPRDRNEWLEPDGMGGFAMGTASGVRTRRYHSLLTVSLDPPADRFALVKDFEAWVDAPDGPVPLSTHHYHPDTLHPDARDALRGFTTRPWPTWRFRLPSGLWVTQELMVEPGRPGVALAWTAESGSPGILRVRPMLACAALHECHRANDDFDPTPVTLPARAGQRLRWRPYRPRLAVDAHASGLYHHAPAWFRNFRLDVEIERGLDAAEDLLAPGEFVFDLTSGPAVLLFEPASPAEPTASPLERWHELVGRESARRASFASPIERSAQAYVVRGRRGKTVIAGYPWFGDWGRDTFIAVRGLCLSRGRLDVARDILTEWADAVSEGMLPNRFPDSGHEPEYNAVDASLWYAVAVGEYLERAQAAGGPDAADARRLRAAVDAILNGYSRGTRFGIRLDTDGLIAAGQPGVQLTWMDAKCDGTVFTPRIGKPVEVQALWFNALHAAARWDPSRAAQRDAGLASFERRFWNESLGCLFDVVDADHVPGRTDPAVRPNQVLALGGLPLVSLTGARAERVLNVVRAALLTPLGLRTLAPDDPAYRGRFQGSPWERDSAYHQGPVWPWLIGPFVEAVLNVGRRSPAAHAEAARVLRSLLDHLAEGGLDHISELFDGDAPRLPRGCPFQAWSVSEVIRVGHTLPGLGGLGITRDMG